MANTSNDNLAFLKYQGKLVNEGILDARRSAEVLMSFDEIVKYFLIQENPELSKYDIEIPVIIKQDSWDIIIPDDIDTLFITGIITWGIVKYAGSALSEMAKNDFKDIGFRSLIQKAFESIAWTLKLGKHRKGLKKEKIEGVKFLDNNTTIGIPDESGNYLYVPKRNFDIYVKCPEHMFSGISNVIEPERELSIGLCNEDKLVTKITHEEKKYFIKKFEDKEELVCPELIHNEFIRLEGHVTKGNENSNNIGFLYKDHILTATPAKGTIVQYKDELFAECIIEGYVDRSDRNGRIVEKKPKIVFTSLSINDKDQNESLL